MGVEKLTIWMTLVERGEVPMGEGKRGIFKLFSLRELHFRLEFLIISTIGEHRTSIHSPIHWRDLERKVELTE